MCTSFVVNTQKTIVGWNLDLLDMRYRVRPTAAGVYIEIEDPTEGWLPLFGANSRGDFVGMPTCWPFDERSNPTMDGENIIRLDIDLLLQNKTMQQIYAIAQSRPIFSVPDLTFMGALSDASGNVLHIVPGQGHLYYRQPRYKILTNFSPFKQDAQKHPWMGWDRYWRLDALLKDAADDFDVNDAFGALRASAQQACPTVVSMVYDVTNKRVFWCEKQQWDKVESAIFGGSPQ